MKMRLFKYIENFTTKNWKFSDQNSDIFHISAQNIDCEYLIEPPHHTHNLCFWAPFSTSPSSQYDLNKGERDIKCQNHHYLYLLPIIVMCPCKALFPGGLYSVYLHSLVTRPINKYVCHFLFTYYYFFSFTFYFLIQCLASLWVNFSSVVVSEIYWNPDHIIYRLATELNKPKNIYVYF